MLLLLQVFLCGGEHQLDPVQLINFTGSGIVINGNNIGFGITLAQLFYYPLADHVVGKASERLGTYDIAGACLNKLHHFPGKEPAFTGLIADGNNGSGIGSNVVNPGRRMEMTGFFKGFGSPRTHPLHGFDSGLGRKCRFFAGSQMLRLIQLVIEAVKHEIKQIRNYSLSPFRFQKIHQMIIGGRGKLDKNFPYDADLGLYLIGNRDGVKVLYDLPA